MAFVYEGTGNGILNPARKAGPMDIMGQGAIAATDEVVTDTVKFGIGTKLYDRTNRVHYIRKGVLGTTADYDYSSAWSAGA